MTASPLALALELAATLEALGIPYVLGGSLASSVMGEPRTTVDVDLGVRLDTESLERLLTHLGDKVYVPRELARRALEAHEAFNVIFLGLGLKADLFPLGDGTLDRMQLQRRVEIVVSTEPRKTLWVTSAEDQVLRKLDWYRVGGEVSHRQWQDVRSILDVQGTSLDRPYLVALAAEVGLTDLLTRAALEAGLTLD